MSSSDNNSTDKPKSQRPIDSVFFEQQYGRLCGEHCLNNALQGKSFNPVTLSMIGEHVDSMERGLAYEEHGQTSSNYDDTGYFSVNVLQTALEQYGLTLVPVKSTNEPKAANVRANPEDEQLFIIHENDHWYCIRKFAKKQWILLDSLKKAPEEVKNFELSSMVLSNENNRLVYFVIGDLQPSDGDEAYSRVLHDESGALRVFHDKGQALGSGNDGDADLDRAVALSLGKTEKDILREKRTKFLQRFEQTKNDK